MPPTEPADTLAHPVDARHLFRDLRDTLQAGEENRRRALQDIVTLLAKHFRSDVCSLYQFDGATDRLLLKATKGLRPEAVDQTALELGEGLVGAVAQALRPLALENAQSDDRFAFRPETGEEIYHSFLGVPLLRAQRLQGVLVIQHRRPRSYTTDEVEGCETVAQFLSEILSTIGIDATTPVEPSALRVSGAILNPGLAVGRFVPYFNNIVIEQWRSDDPAAESLRLHRALVALQEALTDLLQQPASSSDLELKELLEADLMLARDKGWHDKIELEISRGLSAEAAVQVIREDLRNRMRTISNDYLRERLWDLDRLSHRMLAKLTNIDASVREVLPPNSIVVCRSLGVPELLRLRQEGLAGLVIADATPSSHLAIVAAAMNIPALGQVGEVLAQLQDGDLLVVDAINGQLIVRPDESVADEYRAHSSDLRRRQSVNEREAHMACRSRDKIAMQVMANAGLLLDLEQVRLNGADGLGLYRTEMAFLIRDRFPSVAEQTDLYSKVYEAMGDKPVIFRSLDVGSDKQLSYFQSPIKEFNPALGWRAIRIGLDHPDILMAQFSALVAAAGGRELRVMFPMVSEVEEFIQARAMLLEALGAHKQSGGTEPGGLQVGLMIEVPALLWDLDRVFQVADFASVGTNDLFQFVSAADRANPKTSGRFDALTPVGLRLLRQIAEAAARHDKPVSVCGELASTESGILALVGCGFRSFSVAPTGIGRLKSLLRTVKVARLEKEVEQLAKRQSNDIRAELEALAQVRDPGWAEASDRPA